ncbi:hypothetical protein EOM09_02615 [bacterium]|nr:hypothetical protein [bacterium]
MIKYLLYIPMSMLFILNVIFLILITVFNWINKFFVFINDYLVELGDKVDSKIHNENIKDLNFSKNKQMKDIDKMLNQLNLK